MSTIREKFSALSDGQGMHYACDGKTCNCDDLVLSFFQKELAILADFIESKKEEVTDSYDFASRGHNIGIKYAALIIRAKAAELNN